ncbi:MAG TPA: hypothetical protein VM124_02205 [Candidatus Limnocylindrales bacterium]|nr:hypothetical protein [Candidatus Limnocylindrales bacterium]
MSELLVVKFGGTSMAKPERVVPHLEAPGYNPDVAVVSAAGGDDEYPWRVTNALLGEYGSLYGPDEIKARYEAILIKTACDNPESRTVTDNIPRDIAEWTAKGDPVEALGEIWSGKLLSIQTGRTFVDARELIFFHNDGTLNEDVTNVAIRSMLGNGGQFVVNGFCGMRADGRVQVFPRGGSDITGALIARALQAPEYHNWSDVPGFMSADPKKVHDAQLLERITYREAREIGNGGSQLLHRVVLSLLGGTGIKTIMKDTFGALGNTGTAIVDERAWQWQPIVSVTGRDDLSYIALHEFGMNEGVGRTVDVYTELKDAGVPYEHAADATDDVSIVGSNQYKDEIEAIAAKLRRPGRRLGTRPVGLVHVVGEGLVQSGISRLKILGLVATALSEAGIEGRGATDVAESATMTLFINPKMVDDAIMVAHSALGLGRKLS